ncbi:hypothetical protein N9C20_06675, partial [Luminiphilus sp.]|nr:hypothetical protein [Luminiphilus sp.]
MKFKTKQSVVVTRSLISVYIAASMVTAPLLAFADDAQEKEKETASESSDAGAGQKPKLPGGLGANIPEALILLGVGGVV